MNKTKIEWVVNADGSQGYTWNPVTGCEHGCGYCYAEKIAMRFQGDFKPMFHEDRLDTPLKKKEPSTVFVCSMADLFGSWVPFEWIIKVLETAKKCPQHTFLFLTKNPSLYLVFDFPLNCWLGTTTDTPTNSTLRSEALTISGPNKKFISAEPLLGDVSGCVDRDGLDWIIIGSLNAGNGPVPASKGGTHREWVKNLILLAQRHNIPIFIKDSLLDVVKTMIDDKYELDMAKFRGLPYLLKGKQ